MLWQICKGQWAAGSPLLLSVCRFVEFDTSVICHVLMYCLGSFLLQDMFISLQEFVLDKI